MSSSADSATRLAGGSMPWPWLWSTRGMVTVAAAYCLVHLVLRVVLSPTLGTDDVEQAIMAQSWEWGYNLKQPPLYTWLLYGLSQLLGMHLYVHALLKYTLLFVTLVFVYLGAVQWVHDRRLAGLATLSMLLMAYLAVGAHQGFTHSMLLSALLAFSFYTLARWRASGSRTDYVVLGVAFGLGALSKYNFLVFVASALGAALLDPVLRSRILNRRMVVSAGVAVLIVLPHGVWLVDSFFTGVQGFAGRYLNMESTQDRFEAALQGLGSLGEGAVLFLAPLWLFLMIYFGRAWIPYRVQADRPGRVVGWHILFSFLIVAVLVVAFGVSKLESRWMHPMLLLFPVWFFARVGQAGCQPWSVRALVITTALFSLLVVAARIGQIYVGPHYDNFGRFHDPYPEAARAIAGEGFRDGTIVAHDEYIGGNFRLVFPRSRIVSRAFPFYVPPREREGQCLLIWDADKAERPPKSLLKVARERLDVETNGPLHVRYVEEPVRFSDTRTLRLGYILWDEGNGDCR